MMRRAVVLLVLLGLCVARADAYSHFGTGVGTVRVHWDPSPARWFLTNRSVPGVTVNDAQAALQRRLRETHPHLMEAGACQRFLAERSSLPEERVTAALASPGDQSASQFVRLLQDLQTLRHSLS